MVMPRTRDASWSCTTIVDHWDAIVRAEAWGLDEVDVDAATVSEGLDELRTQRDAQRDRPGFGAPAGRSVVHLRRRWDAGEGVDPAIHLMEVGADGRRLRQVEPSEDGAAIKSGPDDWLFNPPVVYLFDPDLVGLEIGREAFESEWLRAHHEDAGQ